MRRRFFIAACVAILTAPIRKIAPANEVVDFGECNDLFIDMNKGFVSVDLSAEEAASLYEVTVSFENGVITKHEVTPVRAS